MLNDRPSGSLQGVTAQFVERVEDKERNKSTLIVLLRCLGAGLLHSGISRAIKADDFISPDFVVL